MSCDKLPPSISQLNNIDDLFVAVAKLRRAVAREGRAAFRAWRPYLHPPEIAGSMLNMAHYLALRHRDLRPMQDVLMRHGLSSLGRLEGRVLVVLEAVEGALGTIAGHDFSGPNRWPPAERRFLRGQRRLSANTEVLFGDGKGARYPCVDPTGGMGCPLDDKAFEPDRFNLSQSVSNPRATRILVTLPIEAAENPGYIAALCRRGADAVRINCAHDSADAWIAMASHARAASRACGRPITVLGLTRAAGVVCPDDGGLTTTSVLAADGVGLDHPSVAFYNRQDAREKVIERISQNGGS